jgi:LacI family transcriptional regulator
MPNTPSGRPVRISDIAQAVGVSQMTVSLALRNSPRISEARKRQIHEAAQRMGYQPNAMASMLAHYRHGRVEKPVQAAIAWLNLWPEPEKLRGHKEFDRYWLGAKATAEKFGYHLDEIVLEKGMKPEDMERILTARGIGGVLLAPVQYAPDWGGFHWERFSVLRFGRAMPEPEAHVVTADQVANTILAFEQIRARGYERIGLAGGNLWQRGRLFSAGFLQAQSELPARLRLPPFTVDPLHPDASLPALARWLKREKPDAILSEHPNMPDLLKKCGLRVPEDIGLATTTVLDGHVDAGIYQNPEEIGRVAVMMLLSMMHDSERGIPAIHHEMLVKGKWVDGTSLPQR